MNYQALGEYHAYKKQAEDAAMARFALLHNLSTKARNMSESPAKPVDFSEIRAEIDQIESVDKEMHAAINRANDASALCGEKTISPASFAKAVS